MQHLLLIDDDSGSRAVELHAESSSIGRDASNSIVLHAKDVSRQHAILLRVTSPETNDHSFRIIDGDLRGRPSTNGLFVNGRRCRSHNLRHGDALVFGGQVKARYHVADKDGEADWLLAGSDTAGDFLATLIAAPVEQQSAEGDTDASFDANLVRLASFPELFAHPIVELSLSGEITYLNPAAVNQFPGIQTCQMAHPVLENVIDLVQAHESRHCVREVQVDDRIFEQALNYIPQSDLIRSYLVDITDRKSAQAELQALHDALELQVQERTLQYLEASERLQQEEKALLASYATNRALLNAIPDPMLRLSHLGYIVNFRRCRIRL